jgi:hypothetical protein
VARQRADFASKQAITMVKNIASRKNVAGESPLRPVKGNPLAVAKCLVCFPFFKGL